MYYFYLRCDYHQHNPNDKKGCIVQSAQYASGVTVISADCTATAPTHADMNAASQPVACALHDGCSGSAPTDGVIVCEVLRIYVAENLLCSRLCPVPCVCVCEWREVGIWVAIKWTSRLRGRNEVLRLLGMSLMHSVGNTQFCVQYVHYNGSSTLVQGQTGNLCFQ
jgi:hypothetical protein